MSDKLAALSGIAALMKKKTGDMYAAGLWKASLPFDLLWRCDQTGDLKTKKERLPSWSWISVDGAVKWPVSQEPDPAQPLQYVTSTTYFECGALGTEVCKIVCEIAGQNEFGPVASGRIVLRTKLIDATIQCLSENDWYDMYETQLAVKVENLDLAPFWPDISMTGPRVSGKNGVATESFFLMQIMEPGEALWTWEEALVVKQMNGTTDEFERVGVAANVFTVTRNEWITSSSWFGNVIDAREVVLV
ncbi:hypothetical protein ONS95_009198 [Cadophora gregata]|uniref:uncharacterized protein n=1 Tax=Cadophora gregata TaxID=51156 RepID=UPI0026DCF43C|nr:uncharacterized protein ONS95_009198 [Cadophora gregata]KAK0124222.1 hypothetical protein ONS95_009198 [Cadophora gregata]KAK0129926.1 hypothetical protein ONS96_000469 [Cadophora gregata f. sp. sojae]